MALLKLGALRKKSLAFVSAASYAVRLRLLLSAFGLRAVVLEGSQPLNSRLRAVQVHPQGLSCTFPCLDEWPELSKF